jgi:DNA-binding IclR family transcriptional regulator
MERSVSRAAGRVWGARSGTSGVELAKEKVLLEALGRRGKLTVAGVALNSSLSVEEAHRMLSALAVQGHLEVSAEHGRLLYSLWEGHG